MSQEQINYDLCAWLAECPTTHYVALDSLVPRRLLSRVPVYPEELSMPLIERCITNDEEQENWMFISECTNNVGHPSEVFLAKGTNERMYLKFRTYIKFTRHLDITIYQLGPEWMYSLEDCIYSDLPIKAQSINTLQGEN